MGLLNVTSHRIPVHPVFSVRSRLEPGIHPGNFLGIRQQPLPLLPFHVLASRVPGSASSPQSLLYHSSQWIQCSHMTATPGFCSSDLSKDIILKLEGVLERHHLIVLPHSTQN